MRFRKLKVDIFKKVSGNDEVYDLYKKLSSYYYDKYKKKEKLTNLLDKDLEIMIRYLTFLKV